MTWIEEALCDLQCAIDDLEHMEGQINNTADLADHDRARLLIKCATHKISGVVDDITRAMDFIKSLEEADR